MAGQIFWILQNLASVFPFLSTLALPDHPPLDLYLQQFKSQYVSLKEKKKKQYIKLCCSNKYLIGAGIFPLWFL